MTSATIRPSEIRVPIGYPNDDPSNAAGMTQADYGPDDRVSIETLLTRPTFAIMDEEVQRRHVAMWVACLVETGLAMGIGTGYRSKAVQQANWERNPTQFSNPKTSYHVEVPPPEKGLAVDNIPGDTFKWMHANTARFRLIHLSANEQHHTQLDELPKSRFTYNKDPKGYWAKVRRADLPYLGKLSIREWLAADEPITLGAPPVQTPTDPTTPANCKVGSVLTVGATGADVRCLQTVLRAAGRSITVDGEFGPATEGHVKAIQTARGLGVDGKAGPKTLASLGIYEAAPPPPTPQPCKVTVELVRGAKGASVKCLQAALNNNGQPVSVDGEFGAKTEAAVTAYQRAMGLKADGRAGPQTLTALGVWGGAAPKPPAPFVCKLPAVGPRPGDSGAMVAELQRFLQANGWYAKRIDGQYGPITRQGVQQFQALLKRDGYGPGPVDGIYGAQTRTAGCNRLRDLA